MPMVSGIWRWVGKPYRIEPIGLVAARARLKHLGSKAEMRVTVEAVRGMGNVQTGVRHVKRMRMEV